MNINLDFLTRVLPAEDTYSAETKRTRLWTRCDTNQNGFISLDEIEDELLRTFSINPSQNFSAIIRKSLEEVRKKFNLRSKLGERYLQKKEFRSFVSNLHRHIVYLKIYQTFESGNQWLDGSLIAYILRSLEIDSQKLLQLRKVSEDKRITFNEFEEIIQNQEVSAI